MPNRTEIGVIPDNLRHEETIVQIAEALDNLNSAVNYIFESIDKRLLQNGQRLSNVKDRATKLQDRLKYLQTNLNLKAVKMFSAARYPASHTYKEYELAIPPQCDDINKIPKVYKCSVPIRDIPETYLSSNCKTEDGQYVSNNNLQEKLQFYHVRSKSNKELYIDNNEVTFPFELSSINSLLFSSMDNPYKISTKQTSHKLNDKQQIEDAPDSIIQPWLSSEMDLSSSYLYTPTLGEVPQINVPLILPDLPGIVDDEKFVLDFNSQSPIAPSSAVTTPTVRLDLPTPTSTIDEKDSSTKHDRAIPNLPGFADTDFSKDSTEPAPPPPPPPLIASDTSTSASSNSKTDSRSSLVSSLLDPSIPPPPPPPLPQPTFQPINFNLLEKEIKPEVESKIQSDQNSVLSTLSFQSNFKFSINDIAQKPIDTTQLMQSIKSEEVLRTCQNVSNVLLQIPKYQEKLLNFSTELKTAFCFTDKCNNLTEISVKCEPAVLNVPDLSKALVKQDVTSEKSFLVPEKPKELTSSLDLAEKRRKRKRERNTSLACSSDSEGEEETKDMDLWIIKGPPAKLQYSEKKLAFLAMFGLTTLSMRNEIELCKVEKRYRLNPDPPEVPLETEQTVESVLPIPREHPDVLLHTPDFEPKVGFLKTIGLDIMPPGRRDEAEVTWQYVLQDRKKRRSSNSVTAYCERIAKAYSKNPPTLPKPPQKMRLLDRVKVKQVPERPPPLPPLVPNIVSMGYPALPMPGENGVKQHCKIVDIKIVDDNVDDHVGGKNERPKWTGIEDIMLAYSEYSKEKAMEKKILTSETSKLVAQSNNLRSETIHLERRIYELLSARTALDSERRMLSEKIERINALVRNLR